MKSYLRKYYRKEITLEDLDRKLDKLSEESYSTVMFEERHKQQLREIGKHYKTLTNRTPSIRLQPY